ncbi:MAG: hypothetical protein PHS57_00865 [Alphaproteobacteria bacterium]|nr:hypothetical protein [Alphaproteobacteria bacterium]
MAERKMQRDMRPAPRARGPPPDFDFSFIRKILKQGLIMSASSALEKTVPVYSSSFRQCSLLAVTLGLQMGWSVHERNGEIKFGSAAFRSSAYEGEGMKFLRLRYWLEETSKKSGGFDAVIFADIQIHSSTQSAVVYGGFLGQLTAWCDWRQIPYIGVLMADVRKYVIGSDLTDQQRLIDALRRKGFVSASKETAGALAVLDWALHYKAQEKL